jgi:sugar phosphate isomerase/epimerase
VALARKEALRHTAELALRKARFNSIKGIIMAHLPISVQLYTVRNLTAEDFAGTMKKIAGIGFKNVEMAGYGNLKTAAEAKKALDDAGMKVSGVHSALDPLTKELDKVLADCQTLGTKNVVCPWLVEERRKGTDMWKKNAAEINAIGKKCLEKGFELSYHNHSFEFEKFDGKTAMDIFWENTEPSLVKSELDVYWVKHGGLDPVAYMKQLGRRVTLVHLKDMAAGPDKKFAPVGTGILDFKAICSEAEALGVKYGIVEQDDCYDMPPLEAIKISFENLKKMGVA